MEAYRWSCMCHRYVMLMYHGYAMDGSCIGYRCLGIGHGEEKQTTKHCTNLDQKLTIIGSTPKLKKVCLLFDDQFVFPNGQIILKIKEPL